MLSSSINTGSKETATNEIPKELNDCIPQLFPDTADCLRLIEIQRCIWRVENEGKKPVIVRGAFPEWTDVWLYMQKSLATLLQTLNFSL